METNNKHIYFSLDSDVLRNITFLHNCIKSSIRHDFLLKNKGKNIDEILINKQVDKLFKFKLTQSKTFYYDYSYNKDAIIRKHGNLYINLLKLILQDKVRILITETIYNENLHIDSCNEFIKEYAYFPNLNAVNSIEKRMRIENLVQKYCEPYVDFAGTTRDAPYTKTYNSYAGKCVPTNDAYSVAEASDEMAMFLTENEKHITKDVRNKFDKNSKCIAVRAINKTMGYSEIINDREIIAGPISMSQIGPFFADFDNMIAIISDDLSKAKASEVMTMDTSI